MAEHEDEGLGGGSNYLAHPHLILLYLFRREGQLPETRLTRSQKCGRWHMGNGMVPMGLCGTYIAGVIRNGIASDGCVLDSRAPAQAVYDNTGCAARIL